MGISLVSIMGELFFGGKDAFGFPLGCDFEHEAIVVLIEFERKVDAADQCLCVTNIFADVGVDEVVAFVESNCIVDNFLELERVFVLPPPPSHELHKLRDQPLVEHPIFPHRVLQLLVLPHSLRLQPLKLLFIQYPLSLLIHQTKIIISHHLNLSTRGRSIIKIEPSFFNPHPLLRLYYFD